MMLRLLTPAQTASSPFLLRSLAQPSMFGFASRMNQKRIYVDKAKVLFPQTSRTDTLPFRMPGSESQEKPISLKVKKITMRATVKRQPTPLHDYLNFKEMSGNEILINLNNVSNLGQQEMMAGLLELIKRDKHREHDWHTNPITAQCIKVYTSRVQGYNSKRVIQGAMMLHMLRIRSTKAWSATSRRVLFLLHKYNARDFAQILHLFNSVASLQNIDTEDVVSHQADTKMWHQVARAIPSNFFERVVSMLPMHVPYMTNKDLVRTLEVLVQRRIGGQRLFDHYIYMKIERNVLKFTTDQYCRTVRALADKRFVEDSVFWDDYVFKYATHDANGREGKREFTYKQAKQVWDSLVYLKLRCPMIDLKDTLRHVEAWLDTPAQAAPVEKQLEASE